MLPDLQFLKKRLKGVIVCREQQGYRTAGMLSELEHLPDSYDALSALARKVADLPLRDDWKYREPNEMEQIWKECAPDRPVKPSGRTRPAGSRRRSWGRCAGASWASRSR